MRKRKKTETKTEISHMFWLISVHKLELWNASIPMDGKFNAMKWGLLVN